MENELETYLANCKVIISKYENDKKVSQLSCQERVIKEIKRECEGKNIVIENIIPECNFILANITFELLASGEFHIYRGQLSELSIAPALLLVFNKSLDYLLKNDYIDFSEYKDWKADLNAAILEIG